VRHRIDAGRVGCFAFRRHHRGTKVRSSIGAGLIWDSPFGPLRVDYAYPTSKTNYDVSQRLHFGFGPF
jgi:outer membrane protein assembly factor BamA